MFKGKDLVAEFASKENKYITHIMKILFTEQERMSGLIIENTVNNKSDRRPLDLDRVKLLKGKDFEYKLNITVETHVVYFRCIFH
jgi:hypothetical protein